MKVGFRNNTAGVLSQELAVPPDGNVLHMSAEQGGHFLPPDGRDYVVATLGDPQTPAAFEIVHLSAPQYLGGSDEYAFQVERNQEATARFTPWPVGTPIQALLTAGGLHAVQDGAGAGAGGGGEGGLVSDSLGSLRAGTAATDPNLRLGTGGPHIALVPTFRALNGVRAFEPGMLVGNGTVFKVGDHYYKALNQGILGQSPPSSSPQMSGNVVCVQLRMGAQYKLQDRSITIGTDISPAGEGSVVIGSSVSTSEVADGVVAIGRDLSCDGISSVAIGEGTRCDGDYAIALGGYAEALAEGAIAIGTKVNVPYAWTISGLPVPRDAWASFGTPLSVWEGTAAPEATVTLTHTDIGQARTWQPESQVREGDVVVPTAGGPYAYAAKLLFVPQISDNTATTGQTEPVFQDYVASENSAIWWYPFFAGLAQKHVYELHGHQLFYVTEIGFLCTEVGAVTTGAKLSFGTVDNPTAVLNDVDLPGPYGPNRMLRLPIPQPVGLTGAMAITLTQLAAGGHCQGRFYLRGMAVRTRG
ncbi:hypothetical protein [Comamonas aquatica]|uniref:Uncharacterized protein n=1 Tax=Comamonas aquatica TaxID=225991 RepID=A0AA42L3D7_9BURK|nr:hypothetical protein [Comamonas aquatica]MDH0363470.1 hypothetical protein [Comamonas aquatica]